LKPILSGTKTQKQVVMLEVALALQECAGIEPSIDRTELQPVDVEIDRLLAASF
jgi:hypothetical protein